MVVVVVVVVFFSLPFLSKPNGIGSLYGNFYDFD